MESSSLQQRMARFHYIMIFPLALLKDTYLKDALLERRKEIINLFEPTQLIQKILTR